MMKHTRALALLLATLLTLGLWVVPSSARAEEGVSEGVEWHSGWCRRGEGVAQVIWFADLDRDLWPEGNTTGYDVRCLTAPSINRYLRDWNLGSYARSGWDTVRASGVPGVHQWGYTSLTTIYDVVAWSCRYGSYEGGWNTASATGWVDSFTYCSWFPQGDTSQIVVPGIVPQYLDDSGATSPDTTPTAASPGEQAVPQGTSGSSNRPTSSTRPATTGTQGAATASASANPSASATATPRPLADRSVTAEPQASASASPTPQESPDAPVYQDEVPGELAEADEPLGSMDNPWTLVLLIGGVAAATAVGAGVGWKKSKAGKGER